MPPYSLPRSDLQRLIEAEARRQGLNPALVVALATQESYLNPNAVGDNGKSLGLFQLQPAAAIDAGIDPKRRGDLHENIRGGVSYLGQKLRQSGGDVEAALSRYNRGTPTYKGIGDPRYVENVLGKIVTAGSPPAAAPSLMKRVTSAVSPRSAAAATTTPPGDEPGYDQLRGLVQPPQATAGSQSTPPPAAGTEPAYDQLLAIAQGTPAPRSPALAAEQQQAAQRPWWQRGLQAAAEASPEIALMSPQLPQIEQARAEMTPAEREALRRQEGQGSGSDVGEMLGQMVGSAVLPGAGTALGGTVGAVTGMTAETLAREGRLPTWKEVATEAAWTAVPEVLESGVRGAVRGIARQTRGGRLIRLDEAARRARQLPEVFEAQTRQQVGQQFDAVRASGVQLDTGLIQQEVRALSPGKYADLQAEVRRIDQANRTGGRYQRLMENLRNPQGGVRVAGVPVGDLQDLRSHLRVRAEGLTSHEARQLVENLQQSVDDAIDQGLAVGRTPTGMTVQDLQEARRQWARVRGAEDMGRIVERSIDVTPDLTMSSLNLRTLANSLRRNEGPLAQRVNRSLDQTPGARAAFQREIDDVAGLFQTVELPLADVFGIWRAPGFAMVRQGISSVLASPRGRQVFREAVINGRGALSLNALAEVVNVARRELGQEPLDLLGTGKPEQAPAAPEAPTSPPIARR